MPPVLRRSLQRCLALLAVLVSAWGSSRASVDRSLDDLDDVGRIAVAGSVCPIAAVAAERRTPMVAIGPTATSRVDRQTPSPSMGRRPIAQPAPTVRLGSAGGERAP